MFCFLLCFFWFFKLGKSFIWYSDGLYTHYNFLVYFGEYLRELFANILHGDFSLPMWDFSFGYGADIITTINARIGDPLNYFAFFVRPEYTEILHNFLVVFRIYLAGLSFCYYCYKHNKININIIIGALIYCFSGYIFWAGIRHPYFITPMIYFPLLLWGAEKILHKKSPVLFCVMVFLSAIGNFYFFYMLTILTVLFILVEFILMKYDKPIKTFFITLFKFIFYYLIGVLLSLPLFLPNIIAFFNNARKDIKPSESLLLRNFDYYLEFPLRWISQGSEYGEALGFSAIALICCICLFFIKKNKYNSEKSLFIILTIFLLLPIFGYILNGFSYITNRWMFVYCFLISYIVVNVLEQTKELTHNIKAKKCCILFFLLLCIISIFNQKISSETFLCATMIFGICLYVFFVILPKLYQENKKTTCTVIILLLTIITLIINSDYRFSPYKEDYISEYKDYNVSFEILNNTSASKISHADSNEFYRIDETDTVLNTTIAQNYNGISFYTSLVDYHIDEFHKELAVNNLPAGTLYNYKGLDRRSYLEALFSVKYFTSSSDDTNIPYGFNPTILCDDEYSIYENTNLLPLCYTYDSYITREQINNIPVEERQEIILQSIVLDNKLPDYKNIVPNANTISLKYTVSESEDGIDLTDNTITYSNTNSYLMFNFEPQANCELYIKINNLKYKELKSESDSDSSKYSSYIKTTNEKYSSPTTSFNIIAGGETYFQYVKHRTPEDRYYAANDTYLISLGYFEGPRSCCTINFDKTGIYSFDSLEIISQPVDNLNSYVNNLNSDPITNITTDTNTVSCNVTLKEDKIMFFSIPFNSGWTAYVDGKETEILCGNYMGIAIPLVSGQHNIVLKYETPGLKYGCFAFCLTILMLITYKCIAILIKKINLLKR